MSLRRLACTLGDEGTRFFARARRVCERAGGSRLGPSPMATPAHVAVRLRRDKAARTTTNSRCNGGTH